MRNHYGIKNPNYKDGKTIKKYYCIDCRKLLKNIYAKRCHSCDQKRKVGDKAPSYKDGRMLKIYYCIDCGKKLSMYFCKRCLSCAKKGKNHPNYIDGRKLIKYPSEFNYKLRVKIRERDGYKCRNCGMTEEEHRNIYDRILEIHHIDYNKKNCISKNLITLCKQCNIRANHNRKYWINKFKKIWQKI